MDNRDILFIVLIVVVVYLLKCNMDNNKFKNTIKEKFTEVDESQPTITESIKNLGILARQIQNASGDLNLPANLNTGDGNINTNDINANNDILLHNASLVPPGTIMAYWNKKLSTEFHDFNFPFGWAWCNGNYYLKPEHFEMITEEEWNALPNSEKSNVRINENTPNKDLYYYWAPRPNSKYYYRKHDNNNNYLVHKTPDEYDNLSEDEKAKYVKTPDLQGRFIYGATANSNNTSNFEQKGGANSQSIKLETRHLPPHNHSLTITKAPNNDHYSFSSKYRFGRYGSTTNDKTYTTTNTGNGQSFNVNTMPQYTTLTWIMRI